MAESEALVRVGDDSTLAFLGEVVHFLEGFLLRRPVIHFGCVILLLDALKQHGRPAGPADWRRLGAAFRKAQRNHRNAGALCGILCSSVPTVPDAPRAKEIWVQLAGRAFVDSARQHRAAAEVPPLSPAEFRVVVGRALALYGDDEIVHWLRHGTGPVKSVGEDVARELLATKPPSLDGILAELAKRPRLTGAMPFVAQINGALSVPPRRLGRNELPQGGYSDVTTRGHPEQILPSQFALDELEFLRRYAQNELLFYRREEPRTPARDEMIVLLDQGVRTWGPVRLLLTATLIALGHMAARRNLTLRVAVTGNGGVPCDPLTSDNEALARLLEASDLTADPGLALERVLEEPAEAARDVILLTQPRNLAESNVAAAARRALPPTRLFAVAADAHGQVEFSEYKKGVPTRLGGFRVDLTQSVPPPRPMPVRRTDPGGPWTGDVEPVPFPFRFGADTRRQRFEFDFDESGDWLLTASRDGVLHALRTDGSGFELLPRAMVEGNLLWQVHAVRGVAGGFVVGGVIKDVVVAAHYDLASRSCKLHALGPAVQSSSGEWLYFRDLHCVVAYTRHDPGGLRYFAVELRDMDDAPASLHPRPATALAVQACTRAAGTLCPNVFCYSDRELQPGTRKNWIHLDRHTGTVSFGSPDTPVQRYTPLSDGKPVLLGFGFEGTATLEGPTLVFLASASYPYQQLAARLLVLRVPEGILVGDHYQPGHSRYYALSRDDGALLAFQHQLGQLLLRSTAAGAALRPLLPLGHYPEGTQVELGYYWLAIGSAGHKCVFRWDGGRFQSWQGPATDGAYRQIALGGWGLHMQGVSATRESTPPFLSYDRQRFVASAQNGLIAVLDRFGQVALFEPDGRLVCMFFVLSRQAAVWLPDGTCLGSAKFLGMEATHGAAEKIGRVLFAATERLKGGPT
jgi:hypothetical protein